MVRENLTAEAETIPNRYSLHQCGGDNTASSGNTIVRSARARIRERLRYHPEKSHSRRSMLDDTAHDYRGPPRRGLVVTTAKAAREKSEHVAAVFDVQRNQRHVGPDAVSRVSPPPGAIVCSRRWRSLVSVSQRPSQTIRHRAFGIREPAIIEIG
mmetsp:Transcript_30352/g.51724  ORF Transcript_30352/g.51724 Transcript_30352/m.51724 type:complete len:155 (+) Transcript_30352:598-1062(+)